MGLHYIVIVASHPTPSEKVLFNLYSNEWPSPMEPYVEQV